MDKPQPPYHISDVTWRRIEPHLSGQKGQWGGIAKDNRLFINAVLWILMGHGTPPFHPLERQTVVGKIA